MVRLFHFLAAVFLFLVGCAKPDNPAEIKRAAQKQTTPQSRRVAFSLRDFLESYNQFASHDEKWDSSATNGLASLARARVASEPEASTFQKTAYSEIQRAIEAGCNDPLVIYAWTWLRYPNTKQADQRSRDEWVRAADLLRSSQYSSLRKFWAVIKAAQASKVITSETPQEVHNLRREARALVQEILSEKEIPAEELTQAVWTLLDTVRNNNSQLREFYDDVEKPLFKNWSDSAEAWFIKGNFEVNFAWQARGTGYANTVTKEGWKAFKDHLAAADKALEKSWKIKPMEKTAIRLMTVELGQGKGRDRLEKYFQRAMLLNPNSFNACSAKLEYLYPKWYGSVEEAIRFSWECVASTNWAGNVPLIMLDAHAELAREFYPKQAERDQYWRDPAVWPGIDAAFKKFFQLNPDANGWRHNYFWYACKCEQWDTANEQLPQLGPINYSYFGGKENFEAMAAEAGKRAKPQRLNSEKTLYK